MGAALIPVLLPLILPLIQKLLKGSNLQGDLINKFIKDNDAPIKEIMDKAAQAAPMQPTEGIVEQLVGSNAKLIDMMVAPQANKVPEELVFKQLRSKFETLSERDVEIIKEMLNLLK